MPAPSNRFLFLLPLLAIALNAQRSDPAPVRVAVDPYGSRSGDLGHGLTLRLEPEALEGPELVCTGGPVGGVAYLLLGARRVSIPGPFNSVLLASPDAIVPVGTFDEAGATHVSADVVRKDLIGAAVYLQALGLGGPKGSVCLSAGLAIRFAAGNAQPALDYGGPPSSAVLIAEAMGPARVHHVLHEVIAPTTGWNLILSDSKSSGGVTRLYLTLEQPGASEASEDVLETRRQVIALGAQADPRIEVWICRRQRGTFELAAYALAAELERDF